MASFVTDLWESIFIPGPTPVLLRASNATFAALQLVLLILLVSTHSLHFLALSVISAGLWWSINWFAAELAAVKKKEEQEQAADEAKAKPKQDRGRRASSEETEATDSRATRAARGDAQVGRPTAGEVKQRRGRNAGGEASPGNATQSSVSTEDEWEKVSDESGEKTK